MRPFLGREAALAPNLPQLEDVFVNRSIIRFPLPLDRLLEYVNPDGAACLAWSKTFFTH
jgi:hypothetical protein